MLCRQVSQDIVGYGTQVRCANCATGWVTLDSSADAPTVPHKKCEACRKQAHSQRSERRAQEAKRTGRPRKEDSKKSARGRKPKVNLRDTYGNSLHVVAHADDAKTDIDDDDELLTQPPPSQPSQRPWGRPPTQRSTASRHRTGESSPGPPSSLPVRHTRQGSDLESEAKRLKLLRDVSSSPDPIGRSSQRLKQSASPAFSPQRFPSLPNEPPGAQPPDHSTESSQRDTTPASSERSVGSLLRDFLAPEGVPRPVTPPDNPSRATSLSQVSVGRLLNRFEPYVGPREAQDPQRKERDPDGEEEEEEEEEEEGGEGREKRDPGGEEEEEEGQEGEEEDDGSDEEWSPTRRDEDPEQDPGNRITRRGNRVTSRRRPRATNIDTAPQETP